jgi:hypothetical protein
MQEVRSQKLRPLPPHRSKLGVVQQLSQQRQERNDSGVPVADSTNPGEMGVDAISRQEEANCRQRGEP